MSVENARPWKKFKQWIKIQSRKRKREKKLARRALLASGRHFLPPRDRESYCCDFQPQFNLIPSASFRYKRKAKKRLWNTSQTRIKLPQIEGKFFRIIYGIHERRFWEHQKLKFKCLIRMVKDKNKIKIIWSESDIR